MERRELGEGILSTLVEHLAGYARNLSHRRLPPEVIHQAKRCIIDLAGCALGACGLGAKRAIVAYVLALGGRPRAIVLGYGGRASGCLPSAVALAALANGTVAHHLELDDGQYAFRVYHS